MLWVLRIDCSLLEHRTGISVWIINQKVEQDVSTVQNEQIVFLYIYNKKRGYKFEVEQGCVHGVK